MLFDAEERERERVKIRLHSILFNKYQITLLCGWNMVTVGEGYSFFVLFLSGLFVKGLIG